MVIVSVSSFANVFVAKSSCLFMKIPCYKYLGVELLTQRITNASHTHLFKCFPSLNSNK